MHDWDQITDILNIGENLFSPLMEGTIDAQKASASLSQQPAQSSAKKRLPSHTREYEKLFTFEIDIQSFAEVYRYLQNAPSLSHFHRALDYFIKRQHHIKLPYSEFYLLRIIIRLFVAYHATRSLSIVKMIQAVLEKSILFIDIFTDDEASGDTIAKSVLIAKELKIFEKYKSAFVHQLEILYQSRKTSKKTDLYDWCLDTDYVMTPVYISIHRNLRFCIDMGQMQISDYKSALRDLLDIVTTFIIRIYNKEKHGRVHLTYNKIRSERKELLDLYLKVGAMRSKLWKLEEVNAEHSTLLKEINTIQQKINLLTEYTKYRNKRIKPASDELTSLLATLYEKYYFACDPNQKAIFDPYLKKINDQLELESYIVPGKVPAYKQQRNSCWLAASYRLDAYWSGYKPTDERQFIDELHISERDRQHVIDLWKKDKGAHVGRALNLQRLYRPRPFTPKSLMEHIKTHGPLYAGGDLLPTLNQLKMQLREVKRQGKRNKHALCVVGVVASWFVVVVDSNDDVYKEKIIPFYDFVNFLNLIFYHRDYLRRYNDNRA